MVSYNFIESGSGEGILFLLWIRIMFLEFYLWILGDFRVIYFIIVKIILKLKFKYSDNIEIEIEKIIFVFFVFLVRLGRIWLF